MTAQEKLHERVVRALLLYVPGNQPGFGEVVGEICMQLEVDGDLSPSESVLDHLCQAHVKLWAQIIES